MIDYVAFREAVAGQDLEGLARRAGVNREHLDAWIAGTKAVPPACQLRLGEVLDRNPLELFKLPARLAGKLPEPRYVSDPETLRLVTPPAR